MHSAPHAQTQENACRLNAAGRVDYRCEKDKLSEALPRKYVAKIPKACTRRGG